MSLWLKLTLRTNKNTVRGENNIISTEQDNFIGIRYDIIGNNNIVEFGENTHARDLTVYIRGSNNTITIGKGCRFIDGGELWVEDDGCVLSIGDNTSMINVHLAVTENGSSLKIGNDCMLAYDIDIRTGDSHSIIDESTSNRINPPKDVLIGNHVWIAAHVIILKGVSIGDNCVIATGSVVVNSSSDTNVIYAGNPAKIVKKGVNWDRKRL